MLTVVYFSHLLLVFRCFHSISHCRKGKTAYVSGGELRVSETSFAFLLFSNCLHVVVRKAEKIGKRNFTNLRISHKENKQKTTVANDALSHSLSVVFVCA